MTPEDEQKIRAWAAETALSGCRMALSAHQGPVAELLKRFIAVIGQLAPGLTIRRNPDDAFCEPALIIGQHANIAYQALPAGPELEPFLDALAPLGNAADSLNAAQMKRVQQMTQPVDFELYIAPQCPHCPKTVRRLLPLAIASSKIRLTIVDAALFEARAAGHGVRSVPLVIMDGQYRWSGLPDLDEILTICLERDPKLMSAASLRQIIEAGEAGAAAQMMINSNGIFPALIQLLRDEKWSVRLGAMVTVEYLVDEAPALAEQLIDPLWEGFGEHDSQVQGDAAHVLGLIGSTKTKSILREIVAGPYEDEVVEAAREALE